LPVAEPTPGDRSPRRVCAIDGSPDGGGRTAAAVAAIAAGAEGLEFTPITLATQSVEEAIRAIARSEAVIFGTPVYRASMATPTKALLDNLPRGKWGETEDPLRGKAVAIAACGATDHHFLALNDLRSVLAGFFAAHVVPPGLYVPNNGFDDQKQLTGEFSELARQQGLALVELVDALAGSRVLAELKPQV
jgi:FMN reductase